MLIALTGIKQAESFQGRMSDDQHVQAANRAVAFLSQSTLRRHVNSFSHIKYCCLNARKMWEFLSQTFYFEEKHIDSLQATGHIL